MGKSKVIEVSFHLGTDGKKKHSEFIKWLNENDAEIINSYTTYGRGIHSHEPFGLHYIIRVQCQ